MPNELNDIGAKCGFDKAGTITFVGQLVYGLK